MEVYELVYELVKEEFGIERIWTCREHLSLDEDGIPTLTFTFQEKKDSKPIARTYKFGTTWYKIDK